MKGLVPPLPWTKSLAVGVVVPIATLALVLSKKRLALFWDTRPLVPMNGMEPVVSPER